MWPQVPRSSFHYELLHYLNLALGQLMPNSWRIVISCMVIWTTIADGDMLTVNEFVHLYSFERVQGIWVLRVRPLG